MGRRARLRGRWEEGSVKGKMGGSAGEWGEEEGEGGGAASEIEERGGSDRNTGRNRKRPLMS
jgi:hypothetical protein